MKFPSTFLIKTPAFLRTGGIALVSGLAQQGFSLAHFLLAVSWLSPEALGTWAIYLTLASFVEMARLGLVQNALTHFSAHHAAEKSQIRAAALWLSLGISLVGSAVLWLLVNMLAGVWQLPELAGLFVWYPVLAVLSALVRLQDGIGIAEQNFKIGLVSATVYGVMFAAGLFIVHCLCGEMTLQWLVFMQIPALLAAFLGARWAGGMLRFFGWPAAFWIKKLWHFGRFGMMSNLGSMLMQRVDLLLLSAWVLPGQLAIYNVATRIVSYLDFPLNTLGMTFAPEIAHAHREKGMTAVLQLYEKSVLTLLLITLPLGLASGLGAGWLIQNMAGSAYLQSAMLFQLLVLASVVKPWGRVFGVTLEAIGLPAWNFRLLLGSCAVNGGLNVLLIPTWGIMGAATATGLSLLLTVALGHFWLRNVLPVRPLAPIWAAWALVATFGKNIFFRNLQKSL